MSNLLPNDENLLDRKNCWENFLLKYTDVNDAEELEVDNISVDLGNSSGSDNNNDTEKENAPESVEEEPSKELEVKYNKDDLNKALQLAVQEREDTWKKRGISFTYDRVDEWIKQSNYANRKELVDPETGGHMVEQTHHNKMHVKRKYRKGRAEKHGNYETDSNSITESDTEMSDASSNSSVDTAQYIRANQNHRTSKVTKTIIKKYIVTSKRINHHREISRTSKPNRRNHKPLQAITNAPEKDSSKKRKHRKTRQERNKRHSSTRVPSGSNSSSTDLDSDDEPLLSRKVPTVKTKRSMPTPLKHLSKLPEKRKHEHAIWLSEDESVKLSAVQPRIALKRTHEHISPTKYPPMKRPNVIHNSPANKTTTTQNSSRQLDETIEKASTNGSTRSKSSSIFGMSFKSWAHLPKKVVIYQPDPNTTQAGEQIHITKEHFVKAIGVEATNDLLHESTLKKSIDASSKVILEFPDSDAMGDDSDVDPMDLDLQSLMPKLTVVRDGADL